jgi:hypothetical protein
MRITLVLGYFIFFYCFLILFLYLCVMIRKQKTCFRCKQERYLYARRMCKMCDSIENPEKHGMVKSTTTQKRLNITKEYKDVKKEYLNSLFSEGDVFCFFSGNKLQRDETEIHHACGRVGVSDNGIPLLIDVKGFIPCCRDYHTGNNGYHNMTPSEMFREKWFDKLIKIMISVKKEKAYSLLNKACKSVLP